MKLAFSHWLFDQIHSRNLVYRQCRGDRALDDGCNALDHLLLDRPEAPSADLTPYRNALLELKLEGIENLSYAQFFTMLGQGRIQDHPEIHSLSARAREGVGLYYHDTAGQFARAVLAYLHEYHGLEDDLAAFRRIPDRTEQENFYHERLAPQLWSPLVRLRVGIPFALAMLGIPAGPIHQLQKSSHSAVDPFAPGKVERTLAITPITASHFWRTYMNRIVGQGSPDRECTPDLDEEFLRPMGTGS